MVQKIIEGSSECAVHLFRFAMYLVERNDFSFNVKNIVSFHCYSDDAGTFRVIYSSGYDRSVIVNMGEAVSNGDLYRAVELLEGMGVEVESFSFMATADGVCSNVYVNQPYRLLSGRYVRNLETGKIEMYFPKEEYQSLPEEYKKRITSNFLFSRKDGGRWVSRAKFPNTGRAEDVCKQFGLENEGKVGEKLSYEEQMEKKAERAERRAERYEGYAENTSKRGEQLQSRFQSAAQDISFLTQPNINSSSGRAFTRYRERLLRAYERGFEEFKKSEYYREKAETARATAEGTKPESRSYIDRRLRECEKTIKAQKGKIEKYEGYLRRLDGGEVLHKIGGAELRREEVEEWLDKTYEIVDDAISKSVYLNKCLEELGGMKFSKDNLKVGYIVMHERYDRVEVVGLGKVNFTYRILDGGARGMGGSDSYGSILEILEKKETPVEKHPFKVGDVLKVEVWESGNGYVEKEYRVVKATDKSVTVQCDSEKPIVRRPRKVYVGNAESRTEWALTIAEGYRGTVYRKVEEG